MLGALHVFSHESSPSIPRRPALGILPLSCLPFGGQWLCNLHFESQA